MCQDICDNYVPQLSWLFTNKFSTTRYMKVKRMGITEILRRIWLLANQIKSSESFSKQPTQLIVNLNSSLRHTIVTNVTFFHYCDTWWNSYKKWLLANKAEAKRREKRPSKTAPAKIQGQFSLFQYCKRPLRWGQSTLALLWARGLYGHDAWQGFSTAKTAGMFQFYNSIILEKCPTHFLFCF